MVCSCAVWGRSSASPETLELICIITFLKVKLKSSTFIFNAHKKAGTCKLK